MEYPQRLTATGHLQLTHEAWAYFLLDKRDVQGGPVTRESHGSVPRHRLGPGLLWFWGYIWQSTCAQDTKSSYFPASSPSLVLAGGHSPPEETYQHRSSWRALFASFRPQPHHVSAYHAPEMFRADLQRRCLRSHTGMPGTGTPMAFSSLSFTFPRIKPTH